MIGGRKKLKNFSELNSNVCVRDDPNFHQKASETIMPTMIVAHVSWPTAGLYFSIMAAVKKKNSIIQMNVTRKKVLFSSWLELSEAINTPSEISAFSILLM